MKEGTIAKVVAYYFGDEAYRDELDRALMEFFNLSEADLDSEPDMKDGDEAQLNEWFIFDFRLRNGKTILQDFYERNPLILSEEEMYIYRVLQNNEYGLWKVLKVEPDKGLELENIKSAHKYYVSEKLGKRPTRGSLIRGNAFARFAASAVKWELCV